MTIRIKRETQSGFQPTSRFARTLADNLSWGVNRQGRKVQMLDRGGFVFDLDKQGRIVRMTDNSGKIFKWR